MQFFKRTYIPIESGQPGRPLIFAKVVSNHIWLALLGNFFTVNAIEDSCKNKLSSSEFIKCTLYTIDLIQYMHIYYIYYIFLIYFLFFTVHFIKFDFSFMRANNSQLFKEFVYLNSFLCLVLTHGTHRILKTLRLFSQFINYTHCTHTQPHTCMYRKKVLHNSLCQRLQYPIY